MSESPYEHYILVYLWRGRVSHLLDETHSPNSFRSARCGVGPEYFTRGWYGTGSQAEWDLAGKQRLCASCVRLLEKDKKDAEDAAVFLAARQKQARP